MVSEFGAESARMIGSLILIIGIIVGAYLFMKRFRIGGVAGGGGPSMRILGTLNLAPKRAVALVEVGDQWLVLGVGTENVSLLSKMERPLEQEGVSSDHEARPGSFLAALRGKGIKAVKFRKDV
jgi:flagellar biosynthetic protein FliO